MRLTPDQKIAGSTPAVLGFLFCLFESVLFVDIETEDSVPTSVQRERWGLSHYDLKPECVW